MSLKDPLYALLVAPNDDLRRAITLGEQTCSIREGHRDYHAGALLLLGCPDVPWAVMADIVDVRHCKLSVVKRGEWITAGFRDRMEMMSGLQRYYPDLTHDSPVTIISWKNVRGALVDAARKM